jgi:hypothetical protein
MAGFIRRIRQPADLFMMAHSARHDGSCSAPSCSGGSLDYFFRYKAGKMPKTGYPMSEWYAMTFLTFITDSDKILR